MYDQVITDLRNAYKHSASTRNESGKSAWKIAERQHFLERLQQEQKHKLLEIGAGTGDDSLFFQQQGLDVICTDLTPEMIEYCRQKGLTAYVKDFLHLDFPDASFDAVYALNCLLHVPPADLPHVLQEIQRLLKPGGLFFLGLYGGWEYAGTWPDDIHEPKRFFSYHTDEQMQRIVTDYFELLTFKAIETTRDEPFHFQLLILRRA